MCGINGVWSKNRSIYLEPFDAMRDTLIHRGPDGAGSWIHPSGNIALGHRRLSFMDLSKEGAQPLVSKNKKVIATVNGEIYNYPELKNQLEQKGHSFKSGSDSELIIHGWEEWGKQLPKKLNGMFAFALWDEVEQCLFLARDRFGIKPLYYGINPEEFCFASEIKALIKWNPALKNIDFSQMANFFTYRYIPSPGTIYKDIYKLPPAHAMLLKHNLKAEVWKYWDLSFNKNTWRNTQILEQTNALLSHSVKTHTQSEVPIGSFLSGGYDSSAIVSYLRKNDITINTFCVGFKNWEQSEHQYAKIVADAMRMPFYSKILDQSSLDILPQLIQYYDEPIADISIIPTYQVSKLAAHYNKAVLSGEGADELFAGYTWHYENILKKKKQYFNLLKNTQHTEAFSVEAYSNAMAMGHLRHNELRALFHPDYHQKIPEDSDWFYTQNYRTDLKGLKRFQYMDIKCFMGELVLTKIDRASMANSLEVRVPFLDHNLVEFLFNIPTNRIYKKGYQKYLLNQILQKQLPKSILERKKQGFVGPDKYYHNHAWYQQIVEQSLLASNKILESKELNRLLENREYWKLWKFVVMEEWYRYWIA
jgi:asparagine synthase (glutamine-hydrolysing)